VVARRDARRIWPRPEREDAAVYELTLGGARRCRGLGETPRSRGSLSASGERHEAGGSIWFLGSVTKPGFFRFLGETRFLLLMSDLASIGLLLVLRSLDDCPRARRGRVRLPDVRPGRTRRSLRNDEGDDHLLDAARNACG